MVRRPIQEGIEDWQERISIRSREEGTSATESSATAIVPSLTPFLCYTCHTSFTSRSTRPAPLSYADSVPSTPYTPLPMWMDRLPRLSDPDRAQTGDHVDEEIMVARKMGREEMRNAVKDFLINDE